MRQKEKVIFNGKVWKLLVDTNAVIASGAL
jgi:hypothetical protein